MFILSCCQTDGGVARDYGWGLRVGGVDKEREENRGWPTAL